MNERNHTIEYLKYLRDRAVIAGITITEPSDWIVRLCDEVLELLKEQEPRVLTIETAYETECVWLEIARRTDIFPVRTEANKTRFSKEHPSTDIYKIGVEKPTFIVNDNYGKTWRCWSSRPTDEQREATPWLSVSATI